MKEDKLAKAMAIIKVKGPVIPSQVNKELDIDVLLGSAVLSELVDKGELKISSLKVGNSPLYYAPGQEEKLQQFSNHLNAKDKDTYELLKQKKVLKDKDLEPLRRVSLRQIKDFAKPLNVRINNETILFWKWYLLSNDEAAEIIRSILPNKEVKKEPATAAGEKGDGPPAEGRGNNSEESVNAKGGKHTQKEEESAEEKKHEETRENKETQSRLSGDEKDKKDKRGGKEQRCFPQDDFFRRVKKYFDNNNITIEDYKVNRKDSDIEFTIDIPSSVGTLRYFCKARNKKKFNDGDLSSVFYEGQKKKMPVLFLITGEMTKKAKDALESDFKNMSVKRV